jgi:hypothetical protein
MSTRCTRTPKKLREQKGQARAAPRYTYPYVHEAREQ